MQWEQVAYREVVQGYSKRDACIAILIFSVQMGILFGQGWLYTTDLPLLLMASLNLITALVNMGMALGVVWLSGRRELGLHRQCLGKSMAMGILLATVLLASLLAVQMGIYHHTLHVKPLSWHPSNTIAWAAALGLGVFCCNGRALLAQPLSGILGCRRKRRLFKHCAGACNLYSLAPLFL